MLLSIFRKMFFSLSRSTVRYGSYWSSKFGHPAVAPMATSEAPTSRTLLYLAVVHIVQVLKRRSRFCHGESMRRQVSLQIEIFQLLIKFPPRNHQLLPYRPILWTTLGHEKSTVSGGSFIRLPVANWPNRPLHICSFFQNLILKIFTHIRQECTSNYSARSAAVKPPSEQSITLRCPALSTCQLRLRCFHPCSSPTFTLRCSSIMLKYSGVENTSLV